LTRSVAFLSKLLEADVCVAGRFDHDHVLLRKLLCESLEKRPAHVDTPQPFELAVVLGDRLGEDAVDI
jgi:hypothetical protein